jgi:small subunit ribosomal protein S1
MASTAQQRPTMGDLLRNVSDKPEIKVGDQITGKIIFLAKNQCLMDIENVGLGIVRGKELYNEEFLSRLKIGEEIEGMVIELDNELGYTELSFRAIGRDKIWEEIQKAMEEKITVPARIRDANRGGFLVKVHGVEGFLPASLLAPTHAIKNVSMEDNSLLHQMKKYSGQTFNVKVININSETESIIVSEKSVSDEIAHQKLTKYKVGDMVEGEIVGVVDFGVFIRFDDDLEGLIHISEIAWKKVEDPKKDFKIGQKLKARIVEIDDENRINLSIKQLMENPWVEFSKSTKIGSTFRGTVSKIVSYGAIIVNENDIQGLCHISQISEEQLESPAKIHDILKVGETKDFTILSLESDEKLYLTLLDMDKAKERQSQMAEDIAKAETEQSSVEA